MAGIECYNCFNAQAYYLDESMIQRYGHLLSWKENETVIDIGSADAKFTVNGLLPRLPKDLKLLISADIEPEKVEFAKRNYPNPKVKFAVLDLKTRDLPQDFHSKFDHVFTFYVLHWVYDTRQALENIFTMLKPGGEAFITIVEKGTDISFYNLSKHPKWARYGHEKFISKYLHIEDRLPVWRSLFLDTGFVNLNCFREHMTYRHKNREEGEGFYKSFNPIAPSIPKEDLDEYLDDYIRELRKSGLR